MSDRDFQVVWDIALAMSTESAFIINCWDLVTVDEAYLHKVWTVAKMPLSNIILSNGFDRFTFSVRFCIPYDVVCDLCDRSCPDYMRLGFARQLGML